MKRWAAPAVVLLIAACGEQSAPARDQWLVTISTDAPVPQLGDRLTVEMLHADGSLACQDCRRMFGVSSPADWPVVFGIVDSSGGAPIYVRAKLFHARAEQAGALPDSESTLESIGMLPAAQAVTVASLMLQAACFGKPSDMSAGLSCIDGALAPIPSLGERETAMPGTWPPAAERDCDSPPPPGMSCIPGGAFLLGGHGFPRVYPYLDPLPERIVVLSPFFLDQDELTVAEARALVAQGIGPVPRSRAPSADEMDGACTFVPGSEENDSLPVACVTWQFADSACRALGKRLPSEAEWEYAAGGGRLETDFPWGNDSDLCGHAIVARGRNVFTSALGEDTTCKVLADGTVLPWGPVAGGSAQDITSQGVRNLGGNLAEWVADRFAPYTADCWHTNEGGVLENPVCDEGSLHSARGGSWDDIPMMARAIRRGGSTESNPPVGLGFRCAR